MSYTLLDDEPQKAAFTLLDDAPDPTGSFTENLKAGAGKFLVDSARGAGQIARDFLTPSSEVFYEKNPPKPQTLSGLIAPERPKTLADTVGLPTQADVEEARRLDQPLMDTAGGKVGNIGGAALTFAPAALLPGGGTATGAGLAGGLMGALQPTAPGESRQANAALGTAVGGATSVLGGKVADALKSRAAAKVAESASQKSQNAVRDAALEAGRKAGYVVPPASVKPGLVNEGIESLGGKIATAQTASLKNQKVTDTLAREYLGMGPDSLLSKAGLADAKNVAAEPYRQISKLSPDAKNALESWKQANFEARMQWNYFRKSGNPEAYTTAKAAGDAAEAALDSIEAEAAKFGSGAQLIEALKAARVKIAKISTVESALTSGGHVDAKMIAKVGERLPLKDQLKVIADFAGNFPKAVQTAEKVGGMAHALRPSIGAGVGTVIGGPAGAAIGAATGVAVPWTVRQALLSRAGQSLTANPSYGSALGSRTIAELVNNAATQAALPPATVGGLLYGMQQ